MVAFAFRSRGFVGLCSAKVYFFLFSSEKSTLIDYSVYFLFNELFISTVLLLPFLCSSCRQFQLRESVQSKRMSILTIPALTTVRWKANRWMPTSMQAKSLRTSSSRLCGDNRVCCRTPGNASEGSAIMVLVRRTTLVLRDFISRCHRREPTVTSMVSRDPYSLSTSHATFGWRNTRRNARRSRSRSTYKRRSGRVSRRRTQERGKRRSKLRRRLRVKTCTFSSPSSNTRSVAWN
jgi:hypothetical protein